MSGDLEAVVTDTGERRWTAEQARAIERREGDLCLDAAAGSGKTSVLVERFVRGVLDDGVEVGAILTITFTEKAAAEMRDRIRARLRRLGARDEARAAEGAYISTIHGFCARLLRTNALAAGIDPAFVVLDAVVAARLARQAFDDALEALVGSDEGTSELVASYGISDLRGAVQATYAELRSRGQVAPRLPEVGPAPDLGTARLRLARAAAAALSELAGVEPSARVLTAIERIERAQRIPSDRTPWPGELDALRIPGGNGAALRTDVCEEYAQSLAALRDASGHELAAVARDRLDALLAAFGEHYARAKRRRSGVDFEDLELLSLELLRARPELRDAYRRRFERVMVDELQDTNAVQLALIEAISDGNLFTVGDTQQSIYGFRHADVELFERRGAELERLARRETLSVNFRSAPEILEVINRAFGPELGERYAELVPGEGGDAEADDGDGPPRVELLVIDRAADDLAPDELPVAWRVAEARLLARRVRELIDDGAAARDVVVLTRATTDMRIYEQALEDEGIPTYVIGGRGYWSHPQVLDVVAYLRLLANPRDEEALYSVLASPLVGLSYDALVLIGASARARSRDPWWQLCEEAPGELSEPERRRLEGFVRWAQGERTLAAHRGVQELIERMLDRTGYDLAVLAMRGGQRRLANVRKLMRLAREHEVEHGPDLRGFLDVVAERGWGGRGEDENEAPVEGEALDAVRLMTIHRAKGLEFEIVCVADLGRWPRRGAPLLRVAADGRLGLRLGRPGTGRREAALAYEALGDAQRAAEAREERRLFYVAATRARRRLIFSGAGNLEAVWGANPGASPLGWLGPALVPKLPETGEEILDGVRCVVAAPGGEPSAAGVPATSPRGPGSPRTAVPSTAGPSEAGSPSAQPGPPRRDPGSLSYTALAEFARCGYRFYLERLVGLPAVETPRGGADTGHGSGLSAAERGTTVHALLEAVDFRRPAAPGAEAVELAAGRAITAAEVVDITGLIERFNRSELAQRLAGARTLRREQPFSFLAAGTLITGVLDVLADEGAGAALVVDYKTDRLEGRTPESVVAGGYATQRLIYALAALRSGYERVEVAHVFLERPRDPVIASYAASQQAGLENELDGLVGRVRRGVFRVADTPHRGLCGGCPAEGGLCSWELAMTRREPPGASEASEAPVATETDDPPFSQGSLF